MYCDSCPNLDPWVEPCSNPKTKFTATKFQLEHGDTVQVKGTILPDAKEFSVNLGGDCENLVLHFNPRFDYQNDVNTIVCTTKRYGIRGKEERIKEFPFQKGGKLQLFFTFFPSETSVQLAEGHHISFPNQLGLKTIEYMAVEGDVKIQVLKFLRRL